jgi:hypothetical protein
MHSVDHNVGQFTLPCYRFIPIRPPQACPEVQQSRCRRSEQNRMIGEEVTYDGGGGGNNWRMMWRGLVHETSFRGVSIVSGSVDDFVILGVCKYMNA